MDESHPDRAPGRARKVLVVVNDLFFEAKIGEVLKTLETPVAFAKSEAGLAKRLAEVDPPLALVDGSARGVDGIAAIRAIRAAAPAAPIVAFISHVSAEDAARAKEAGATQVMAKSGFVDQLPALVRKHAGRPAAPDAP